MHCHLKLKASKNCNNCSRRNYGGPLTGKGIYIRTLCQMNEGSVGTKQRPINLRWVVGLLTGHCHLKEHLFKLGLTDDPTCERCLQEDESATHILCDCETIAHLRFRHLGQFFMEPSDFYDAPIFKSYISFGV
jgi:hypothetical protein